ncbi:hypothetical protein NMY22_g11677 [Coprinellus aureogranulatus]|nr:hypothetical protein NMY22_g11677 [Coprinellus aureogranulatus]
MNEMDDLTFCRLSSTNVPPSTSEVTSIQKKMNSITSEVDSIENTVLAMALRIAELQAQKSKLDGTWSSVDRFLHLVVYFHEVAIRVPVHASSYEFIGQWLGRAGTFPKSLHLRGDRGWRSNRPHPGCGAQQQTKHGNTRCPFANHKLAMLLQDGPPLDRLSVRTASPICLTKFAESMVTAAGEGRQGLQSLRSLLISASDWTDFWWNSSLTSLSFVPPTLDTMILQLPSVSLLNYEVDEVEFDICPTALNHVNTFQLKCNWSIDFAFKVIQHCTAAKTMHLEAGCAAYPWTDGSFMRTIRERGIWLPNLEVLSLVECHPALLHNFEHLKLPSLLRMSISLGDHILGPYTIDTRNSKRLITLFLGGDVKRQPTLVSLQLTNGDFEEHGTLFDTLYPLSSLTELTLTRVTFEVDLFENILSGSYLPNLKTLKLLELYYFPEDIPYLDEFVQTRGINLKTSQVTSED